MQDWNTLATEMAERVRSDRSDVRRGVVSIDLGIEKALAFFGNDAPVELSPWGLDAVRAWLLRIGAEVRGSGRSADRRAWVVVIGKVPPADPDRTGALSSGTAGG
jgi:hypothetical protein